MTSAFENTEPAPEFNQFWWGLRHDVRLGRNALPKVFFDVLLRKPDPRHPRSRFPGFPTIEQEAFALFDAYTSADWPCLREERRFWVAAFGRVGFLSDGWRVPNARPTDPVRLWRAAHESELETEPGLSWSASHTVADFFVDYNRRRGRSSRVYTTVAPPAQLLARATHRDAVMHDTSPELGAHEWIADVRASQMTR